MISLSHAGKGTIYLPLCGEFVPSQILGDQAVAKINLVGYVAVIAGDYAVF